MSENAAIKFQDPAEDAASRFEAEARALYERHSVTGFFTYMLPSEARSRGALHATRADRIGTLIDAQGLSAKLMEKFRRASDAPLASGAA